MSQFSSPILLITFNRPDTTKLVFAEIKKQKPAFLYIACDGPRDYKDGEVETVNSLRNYLLNEVDWDCEVKTLFRDKNLGCGIGVSSAITWFFEHVKQGIILEDDCVPLPGFFEFCDEMLNYYKNDERVYEISGSNLQAGNVRGDGSYYFSHYGGIWGWATWSRAWKNYDYEMKNYDQFIKEKKIDNLFKDIAQRKYWVNYFKKVKKIDTWDYQWMLTRWHYNGLSIVPNINLIKNIGFNNEGTHTKNEPTWYKTAINSTGILNEVVHLKDVKVNVTADDFLFDKYIKPSSLLIRGLGFLKRKLQFN